MDIPARTYDLTGQQFKRNPFPTFECMRAEGPAVRVPIPLLGPVTMMTTHVACTELLKSPERFVVDLRKTGKGNILQLLYWSKTIRVLGQSMLAQDDPQHRRLRQFADQTFHARSMDIYRDRIVRTTNRLLDRWAAGGYGDFVDSVARRLPLIVICDILGMPEDDQEEFISWMAPVSEVRSAASIFTMIPLMRRIVCYLQQRIAHARARSAPHLISALVHASKDGDQLGDDELVAMIFLLFAAGHETTTHMISGAVLTMLQHPEQLEALCADWTRAPIAVEELLRYVSAVQMTKPRFALQDTRLAGVDITKGQMCMALLASANTDPDHFNRPHVLDLQRQKNRHLAFGGGPHSCLGMHLARLEMQVVLEQVFTRYPGLRLATAAANLRWTGRGGIRALRALPLKPA